MNINEVGWYGLDIGPSVLGKHCGLVPHAY